LLATFCFIGAWTIGRRVVDTLGSNLVSKASVVTLETSIAVLSFISLALFVGNVFSVPDFLRCQAAPAIGRRTNAV